MFSPNEDADDLATADVKLLLIPHLQAEAVVLRQRGDDLRARLGDIQTAQALHEAFLGRAQQYGAVRPAATALVAAVLDPEGAGGAGKDTASLRQAKIERFKLERAVKARLEAAEAALRGRDDGDGEDGGDAEALERETAFLRVEAAALASVEALRSLRQEGEVVAHAAAMAPAERAAARAAAPAAPPADLVDELRRAAGALKLGAAATQREELRAAVFRPSHIMHSLSVEQQGDIEVAQMLAARGAEEERERAAAAARAARGRAADDAEAEEVDDDAAIARARAMDDWKDDNPRGWGNSRLRPCGR